MNESDGETCAWNMDMWALPLRTEPGVRKYQGASSVSAFFSVSASSSISASAASSVSATSSVSSSAASSISSLNSY